MRDRSGELLLLLLNVFVITPYVKWMQLQCKQWIVGVNRRIESWAWVGRLFQIESIKDDLRCPWRGLKCEHLGEILRFFWHDRLEGQKVIRYMTRSPRNRSITYIITSGKLGNPESWRTIFHNWVHPHTFSKMFETLQENLSIWWGTARFDCWGRFRFLHYFRVLRVYMTWNKKLRWKKWKNLILSTFNRVFQQYARFFL